VSPTLEDAYHVLMQGHGREPGLTPPLGNNGHTAPLEEAAR